MIAILLMTLAQFIAHTRAELAKAPMERVELGESVYWVGAPGRRPAGRRDDGATTLVLLHGSNDQAGTCFEISAGARLHISRLPRCRATSSVPCLNIVFPQNGSNSKSSLIAAPNAL